MTAIAYGCEYCGRQFKNKRAVRAHQVKIQLWFCTKCRIYYEITQAHTCVARACGSYD